MYLLQDKVELAIAAAEEAVVEAGGDVFGWLLLADAYHRLGATDMALVMMFTTIYIYTYMYVYVQTCMALVMMFTTIHIYVYVCIRSDLYGSGKDQRCFHSIS